MTEPTLIASSFAPALSSTLVAALTTLLLFSNLAAAEAAGVHASAEGKTATATFSMYCYWTGEATLGQVPGVLASRIGHQDGAEIVQVDYDPSQTGPKELVAALQAKRSFYSLFVDDSGAQAEAARFLPEDKIHQARGESHFIAPKHSLRTRHPELLELDLTEAQAIALNSWSYFGGPMPDVLTAEQAERWRRLATKH